MRKKIVVLSGAGISAESGISTFRDANGLWEGHDVMEVASPQGWIKNSELVNNFYNTRRRELSNVKPNAAHLFFAKLEAEYDVEIITQNVDDLHERAGSNKIIHLHGELLKVRSTKYPNLIYDWSTDLTTTDVCEKGHQLRPHIVWFGEAVPLISVAAEAVASADLIVIIGTSMQVYPAAGLVQYARKNCPVIYIDKNPADVQHLDIRNLHVITAPATVGVLKLSKLIFECFN